MLKQITILTAALAIPSTALAGFDWGGDCSEGYGDFEQHIPRSDTTTVGEVPAGKANVRIDLHAVADVDVQLIDVLSGTEIIAWPSGMLDGPAEECTTFDDVTYCYSGYNGDQTPGGRGNEWIEVYGTTNRLLEMRAFGYHAGDAFVAYSWEAASTCNEIGDGAFSQWIPQEGVIDVGTIAAGKVNVLIDLVARQGRDVDVQLIDPETGTEIIAWPGGLLNGPDPESVTYAGMTIEYSGYNGIGGDWGHESIEIVGETTVPLLMAAYGYQSGTADIDYAWGDGAGEACSADWQCAEGLFCKEDGSGGIVEGVCHSTSWCESAATAAIDCVDAPGRGWFGTFGCEVFECVWQGW